MLKKKLVTIVLKSSETFLSPFMYGEQETEQYFRNLRVTAEYSLTKWYDPNVWTTILTVVLTEEQVDYHDLLWSNLVKEQEKHWFLMGYSYTKSVQAYT